MKKNIIIILLACAFFSCKKSGKNEQPSPQKEYTVSFNLKGFTQAFEPIQKTNALTGAATDTVARTARLLIYDAQGKFYRKATASQDKLTLILPAGSYTAVIAGCDTNYFNNMIIPQTTLSASSLAYYDTYNGSIGSLQNFEETFYKKITFSVSNSDVLQTVTLDRVNTQVQVNILDAIPAKTNYISIKVDSVPRRFSPYTGKPILNEPKLFQGMSYFIKDADINKTNLRISMNFLPDPSDEVKVTISAVDGNNKLFASKIINNVKFNVNKITVLNGNLFGGTGTSTGNMTVKADSTWSSEVIYKSF